MMMADNHTASDSDHALMQPRMEHCPYYGFLSAPAFHAEMLSFTASITMVAPRSTRAGLWHQTSVLMDASPHDAHETRGPPVV